MHGVAGWNVTRKVGGSVRPNPTPAADTFCVTHRGAGRALWSLAPVGHGPSGTHRGGALAHGSRGELYRLEAPLLWVWKGGMSTTQVRLSICAEERESTHLVGSGRRHR